MDWPFARRTVQLDRGGLPKFAHHYNAGLFRHPSDQSPHVVLRCHDNNSAFDTGFWHACKRSQLWVARLDAETYQPVSHTKIEIPLENCEDPRAVVHDGRIYVFFTHFTQGNGQKYDPYVAVLDGDFNVVELHPIGLFGRGETEKNWQFFRHKNAWHAVYSHEPWQIVCFDSQWRGYAIHKANVDFAFPLGELRGGTPPVLVDGSFWTWFHAVWIHPDKKKRVYSAGVVSFEGNNPYTPTGVSLFPLIMPDLGAASWVKQARIVFPCGALFDEGKREWVVSCGAGDTETRLDFIPHKKVVDPWLFHSIKPAPTYSGSIA
jgi:predicted GH43/DUF377 family glycosyl hydrolase